MKNIVLVTMLIDGETRSEAFCKPLLECLYLRNPMFSPEFASFYEPINNAVPDIESALKFFCVDNTSWLRKKPSSQGDILHSRPNKAASLSISIRYNKETVLGGLFEDLIATCDPKYAYIHLCTEGELDDELEDIQMTAEFFTCAADIPIRKKGFNNLAWSNYFSESYLEKIDIEGLEENGFEIEQFHHGVLLRISESLEDVVNDFNVFSARRKVAKSFFVDGFFRKPIPVY